MAGWNNFTTLQKRLTVSFGTIAAICTGLVAVPPAWTQLGLPRVAFESYVEYRLSEQKREIVKIELAQQAVRKELSAARLDLNYMRQSQLEGEKLRLEGDLQKVDNEGYKTLIRQRIRQLEDESSTLSTQNRALQSTQ